LIRGPDVDFLELRIRDLGRPPILTEAGTHRKAEIPTAKNCHGAQPQSPTGAGNRDDAVRIEAVTFRRRVDELTRIRLGVAPKFTAASGLERRWVWTQRVE
jgi:hypothetical protein